MKLAAPSDLIKLQESGQLQTLPEYPAGGGPGAPHASHAELINHNQLQMAERQPLVDAHAAAAAGPGTRVAPNGYVDDSKPVPGSDFRAHQAPQGDLRVPNASANPVVAAEEGGANPNVAPRTTTGNVSQSVTPPRNPSVEQASEMDPMRSGGGNEKLGKK